MNIDFATFQHQPGLSKIDSAEWASQGSKTGFFDFINISTGPGPAKFQNIAMFLLKERKGEVFVFEDTHRLWSIPATATLYVG